MPARRTAASKSSGLRQRVPAALAGLGREVAVQVQVRGARDVTLVPELLPGTGLAEPVSAVHHPQTGIAEPLAQP